MKTMYAPNTANFPRLATDVLFADYDNQYSYRGFVDHAIRNIESIQLLDAEHWHRFVTQFQLQTDTDNGWRCEFWGKMMRGACLTYSYTQNPSLYQVLTETVNEMLNVQEETGRISSYPQEKEFKGWDMWGRKYVLLGMQYFLEICNDEALKARIITSMCRQVDYIMAKIGDEPKKIPITKASNCWRGLNSSSILEPVVRLYNLTANKKYLDFADYIVECGGTSVSNIFELAFENHFPPYQYPITKAYEMISCFEGLLEYYRVTGIEKYKIAIIHFAEQLLKTELTVTGSAGCTHEQFDHGFVRQANTNNADLMQETCVTVTLMKFFYQMFLFTGDTKYADAFEIALYNAYFGSFNTEQNIDEFIQKQYPHAQTEVLPFDSYSPLTVGKRGKCVGGLQIMPDNHYYGCCACIASAGNGLIPKMQLLTSKNGFAMNLYINGSIRTTTPNGNPITFVVDTDYPKSGIVNLSLLLEKEEEFTIALRNPAWSQTTTVQINGEDTAVTDGSISISRIWKKDDRLTLNLDMRTQAIYPTSYGTDVLMTHINWAEQYIVPSFDQEDPLAKYHIALRRGPIMLAQESRLGYNAEDPIDITIGKDGYVDAILPDASVTPYLCIVEAQIPLSNGSHMLVTDYASAGKRWNDDSKIAVWMLTKNPMTNS